MTAKQFLEKKGISNSDFMDDGVADLIEKLLTEYEFKKRKITIQFILNDFLDWMKSDCCWIEDSNGNKIKNAIICGKHFFKYAEKYKNNE